MAGYPMTTEQAKAQACRVLSGWVKSLDAKAKARFDALLLAAHEAVETGDMTRLQQELKGWPMPEEADPTDQKG